jgi:hypothetical protein
LGAGLMNVGLKQGVKNVFRTAQKELDDSHCTPPFRKCY